MDLKSNEFSDKNHSLSTLLYKLFKINLRHIANVDKNIKCSNCGSINKKYFYSKCKPDFNANILPKDLFRKFYSRAIGKCSDCNLIQDFNHFNLDELERYEKILISKDQTVSEEIWHSFPIPEERKKYDFEIFFKKRFLKWDKELKIDRKTKNILFLRPSFGTVIKYFKNFHDTNFYFMDISEVAKKTIKNDFPQVKELEGNIHGIYRGKFLDYKNFFDLIISNHHILHCFNLSHTFTHLKNLMSDSGKIIFMNEIIIKEWNPFHIFFMDENIFTKILNKNFKKIEVIRNCGPDEKEIKEFKFISDYTKFRDNPDFVVSEPIKNIND